ncbi:MAG: Flp pilus assembly protein CpaB [bacterium]
MNIGKIVLLGIALVAGGAAFFLVVSGDNAPEQITQIVPVEDKIETVRVLVADADFSRGQRLDPALTKWVKWPKKGLAEGLITDGNQEFYNSLPDTVARTNMVVGEPIMETKLIRSDSKSMMAALLSPGMRAVSIDVTSRQAASGFILPGDHVDLYYTEEGIQEGTDEEVTYSSLLYSNVRVIAVDQNYDEGGEGAFISRTITMELAPYQVERFLSAREAATVSLVLRSVFQPDDAEELQQEVEPAGVVVVRYGQS